MAGPRWKKKAEENLVPAAPKLNATGTVPAKLSCPSRASHPHALHGPGAAVMRQLTATRVFLLIFAAFLPSRGRLHPVCPGVELGRRQRGGETLGWGSLAAHAFVYGNNTLPLTWFLVGQCSRGSTSTMLLLALPTRRARRGSVMIFIRSCWRGEVAACPPVSWESMASPCLSLKAPVQTQGRMALPDCGEAFIAPLVPLRKIYILRVG